MFHLKRCIKSENDSPGALFAKKFDQECFEKALDQMITYEWNKWLEEEQRKNLKKNMLEKVDKKPTKKNKRRKI